MRRAHFKFSWIAAVLLAPQLLIIFVFFYWPSAQAMYWAFTLEQPWGGGNTWVGFDNFRKVLTDPYYWASVKVSMIYAFATTALSMAMALTLAMFVDRQLAGYRAYRVTMILPYAVAAPAVGLAFRFVFNPQAGVFSFLNTLSPGIWDPGQSGWQAVLTIILAGAWKHVAYSFIFFLAALQSIPRSLTEASAMDGARPLRRMVDLQLPLLTPTLFFLVIINLTDSFTDSFGIVDTLTGGGPFRATDLMVYKIYADGFRGFDYSGAAAQSIVLMALVMALTFVQFRYVERRVHYS
ncbi:ABC transporter permease subunit [Neogemmobacter tilapiae]|uniref:sn-glycerol-3-phosphate transport system permease protein UgpA n=1 Tax=Neogemmobacter tilapiae TaxID=875041 RepID=A0A918TLV5_9RHOB|nr:ABC transporter permease subunit [Gemmobacter tilapiae]GHC53452.1 glycerol-3-phosphate transporter permease [Gemmobacter tilapiae]